METESVEPGGTFGALLRQGRARLRITQEELARRSGVSVRAIRALEAGSAQPRRSTVALLSGVLDIEHPADATEHPAAAVVTPSPAAPLATPRPFLPPAQLPRDVNDFVGRAAQIEEVTALLSGPTAAATPIVALSGMGGIGKTTLAVRCAHAVRKHYPDGQFFVPLRGVSRDPESPAQVLPRLLRSMDVPGPRIPDGVEEQAALFRSLVADRSVLLVMDDARDARQIRPLLPGGSGCAVIVTSRRFLSGVEGARHLVLPPLAAAEPELLFSTVRGRSTDVHDVTAVADILRHCGGLPLAIRIIAARLAAPGSDAERVARQLEDSAQRMDGFVAEDLSVRVTMESSLDSLVKHPLALSALSCVGHWPGRDIESAAICAGLGAPEGEGQAALEQLLASSLLLTHGGTRYYLHDLVKLYVTRHWAGDPSAGIRTADAQVAAMGWYLATLDAAIAQVAPYLKRPDLPEAGDSTPPPARFDGIPAAMAWCSREYPNLLALIRHAAERGLDRFAWQVAVLLMPFFEQNMYWSQSIEAHEIGLDCARRSLDEAAVARMLIGLTAVHLHTSAWAAAVDYGNQAVVILRRLDDEYRIGIVLDLQARALSGQGSWAQSRQVHEEALRLRRQHGTPFSVASSLHHISEVLFHLGDTEKALACLQEALEIAEENGISHAIAPTLQALGATYRQLGELATAAEYFTRAVSAARLIGSRIHEAENLRNLGDALLMLGRIQEAVEPLREALALMEGLDHPDAAELRARVR